MDTLERIHELITRAKRIGLTGVEVTITDTFNYLFLHECSEKENTVLRNFFPDLDKMEAFLESLETYKVGDKIKCGNVMYLICYQGGLVFLINLETGINYGTSLMRRRYDILSRRDVEDMFDWREDVDFVKVN